VARLILDTGVLVAGARGQVLPDVSGTDDVCIAAVAVAEYLAGTLLDADPARSAAQRAFLEEVLQVVPVLEYDEDVAGHYAELLAHVRRVGEPRGAHDLLLAATALSSGRTIVTTDENARFSDLPGVDARVVGR
jgi:tRNA(fMet)-specific endonuclease VapC